MRAQAAGRTSTCAGGRRSSSGCWGTSASTSRLGDGRLGRRAPARSRAQRAVRSLPRLDAVPELRRAARRRRSGAGAGGARRRAGAADGVKLLELRSRVPLPIDLPVSHRKITVVLDLPADAGALWKALGSKLRSQVRRPQKEGRDGALRPGGGRAVLRRLRRAHARPRHAGACRGGFFQAIAATFGEDVWFGCAYHRGRPVACGAGFRWGGEFEMTWASALARTTGSRPTCCSTGRSWSARSQAGADAVQLRPLHAGRGHAPVQAAVGLARRAALVVPARAGEARPARRRPTTRAYAWGPRLWRRLPLPLATALGPRIVRFIP